MAVVPCSIMSIIRPFVRLCSSKQPRINIQMISRTLSEQTVSKQDGADSKVDRLHQGILTGQRGCLAEAITLVETLHPKKYQQAQELLKKILNFSQPTSFSSSSLESITGRRSFRIGLSGPPGSGKSTFIENFGRRLTGSNHRVAVLAVDPSSSKTGGSLLGDKTRMPDLSRDPSAYIRPSPSGGTLGGVNRSTNEAILLCEAAGYDVILVETVGVGQSEFAVAHMVDMFVLLIPPASGDELQGIKKGIVELADLVVVNKADGELLIPAQRVQAEYISALKLLRKQSPNWSPVALLASAKTGEGIEEVWKKMQNFHKIISETGEFEEKRQKQHVVWMWNHIQDQIMRQFKANGEVQKKLKHYEQLVAGGLVTPGLAADSLLKVFLQASPDSRQ